MGDPERLLGGKSDLDDLERALLRSVRHVGPPEGAKAQAWDEIATKVATAALVGTAVSTATSSASSAASVAGSGATAATVKAGILSSVTAKVGLFVLGSAALSGGAFWMSHEASPPAAQISETPGNVRPSALSATVSPSAQQVSAADEPEPTPPAVPDAANKTVSPARPRDLLQAESRMLTEARAALRSGNISGAETSLNRIEQQFPRGMLGQEREVLAIEVLAARGNLEGARRRARAFVKAYPRSPHSAKLQRFLD